MQAYPSRSAKQLTNGIISVSVLSLPVLGGGHLAVDFIRVSFDVRNGTAPDSVGYRDAGGADKVVWKS